MVAAGKVRVGNRAGSLIEYEYWEEVWIDINKGKMVGFREQRT